MQLYYASITDHAGTEVLRLKYTTTAKHSAFIASQYVLSCPPAAGFKIKKYTDVSKLAELLNDKEGH